MGIWRQAGDTWFLVFLTSPSQAFPPPPLSLPTSSDVQTLPAAPTVPHVLRAEGTVYTHKLHTSCAWLPPGTQSRRFHGPYLLDHDAIGSCQLQPAGKVEGVHPAQDQGKDHDSQVGFNSRQVEGRRDNHQHGVDEAASSRDDERPQRGEGTMRHRRARRAPKPSGALGHPDAFWTPRRETKWIHWVPQHSINQNAPLAGNQCWRNGPEALRGPQVMPVGIARESGVEGRFCG